VIIIFVNRLVFEKSENVLLINKTGERESPEEE